MLYPELEGRLHDSKCALSSATTENIIHRCKQYLALLAEYRVGLHKLPDTLDLNSRATSLSSRIAVDNARKEVRAAIEQMTQERNRVSALLLSFTAVSGYEATATLNRLRFKDHDTWELKAGGVRSSANAANNMTVLEAVEAASPLRRKEHIAIETAHHKVNSLTGWETETGRVTYDNKY